MIDVKMQYLGMQLKGPLVVSSTPLSMMPCNKDRSRNGRDAKNPCCKIFARA